MGWAIETAQHEDIQGNTNIQREHRGSDRDPGQFLEAPFLDVAGCGPGSDLTLGGHGTPGLLGASRGGQAASMGTHSLVLTDPALTGPLCLAP